MIRAEIYPILSHNKLNISLLLALFFFYFEIINVRLKQKHINSVAHKDPLLHKFSSNFIVLAHLFSQLNSNIVKMCNKKVMWKTFHELILFEIEAKSNNSCLLVMKFKQKIIRSKFSIQLSISSLIDTNTHNSV